MSSVRVEAIGSDSQAIPFQEASLDIWDKKYRLKSKIGEIIDATIDDTYKRIARALAKVEQDRESREQWYGEFLWALRRGAIPAGRITSNAGAREHKPATSTINCTVSGIIQDSMNGILDKVHEAGLTLKAGCGIGYEFSTLRPKGAYVSGAGAYTSGPLSFMDIYDKMCFTVSSAGGRRGAQMATFEVGHPDVIVPCWSPTSSCRRWKTTPTGRWHFPSIHRRRPSSTWRTKRPSCGASGPSATST
jgi:ribonucleoside-diphosphate reductase alpha chain